MITAGAEIQVLVATRPVDFRKQADGLAAIVQAVLAADPEQANDLLASGVTAIAYETVTCSVPREWTG